MDTGQFEFEDGESEAFAAFDRILRVNDAKIFGEGTLEADKAGHRSRYTLLRRQSPHQRGPRKSVAVSVRHCAQRRLDFGSAALTERYSPQNSTSFLITHFVAGTPASIGLAIGFSPSEAIFRGKI